MNINPNPAGQVLGYLEALKGRRARLRNEVRDPTPRIEDALKSPLLDVVT